MGSNSFIDLLDTSFPKYSKSLSVLFGLLLRWLTALHSYSGEKKPPMFGDYEAQRHWMEITLNLPTADWYFNTTQNDLLYWGLDYPPLTAYHSLVCGYIANLFVPNTVQLWTSRGHESYESKLFMRATVLVSDCLIYIPAIIVFFSLNVNYSNEKKKNVRTISKTFAQLVALLYPGLILIDHGHFQYNCISLGLFIWAIISLSVNKSTFACVLFTLSLNYKQMELYHALPFFFYYLGLICKFKDIKLFLKLSITTIAFFTIVWSPFLNLTQLSQILHRIFPIYRGIFEDKVANFWCTANVFYKFKASFTNDEMAFLCLCVTVVSVLPSCVCLLRNPRYTKFQLSCVNVSLAFFLFSYHVHEKSILLVSIPVLLYLPKDPFPSVWFLMLSTFSMFDLFIKDNLVIPSLALTFIFYLCVRDFLSKVCISHSLMLFAFHASMAGCLCLICVSLCATPPQRYLYLFSLFISSYSFLHFILFFVYFYCQQLDIKFTFLRKTFKLE